MEIPELKEGDRIEGNDLSPLVETAQIVVPKKGSLFEEKVIEGGHKVKVAKFAIIRPCQSRGKSIRGHQPIYEPSMLAENAAVFSGWPMYIDHMEEELVEEMMELLQEKGRSLNALGGRVLRSFYDPDLVFEDDSDHGYRKGGVVGEVIPQKKIREMLEEDPGAINVSINAWPKAIKIGSPSWDTGKRGAVIEGIRPKPMGSVDFVFKGGAGGRPLTEEERASAVSLLESCLTSPRDDDRDRKEPSVKLSAMTEAQIASLSREELAEALAEENPSLAENLRSATPAPTPSTGGVTPEQLAEALDTQRAALIEEFGPQLTEDQIEERAEEIVTEREALRELATHATDTINELERNGLPAEFGKEIRKNYALYASGAAPGLLVQEGTGEDGATISKREVITEAIKEDARTAVRLIEASGGNPRIKGLGRGSEDPNGESVKESKATLKAGSAFREFLHESGDLTGDEEHDSARLGEILSEGAR